MLSGRVIEIKMENKERDALKELLHDRVTEKQTAEIFQPSYFPEPTKNQILESEKLQLQTRLVEISKEQGNDIWLEHERIKEIEKRKSRLRALEYEKRLSENQIGLFWDSNRSCNPAFNKKLNPGPV